MKILYSIFKQKSTELSVIVIFFVIFLLNIIKNAHISVVANKRIERKADFNNKKTIIYAIITGVLSGFINGVFGGGGGMIVVPMLVHLLKRVPQKAHATAILIILPLSIISGVFYISFGNFSLNVGLPAGIGVVLGGVFGAILLSKLSSKTLAVIFSVVMAVAGVKMLFF